MRQKVIEAFKAYTHALYGPDWDAVIAGLYSPDVIRLHAISMALLELIEPFGEQREFLRFFPEGESAEDLKKRMPEDFAKLFLSGAMGRVSKEQRMELIETMSIDKISVAGVHSKVDYSFSMTLEGESFTVERDADLILEEGRWYVRLRAGFDQVLERFQRDIDLFNDRKRRDRIQEPVPDEEMRPFAIYGYRSRESNEILIEPRFVSAGEFSEGLAPVRIFSKYGYIDKRGEIAIKPEFLSAESFSEGYAAVGLYNEELEEEYGYINRSGAYLVMPRYEAAKPFSEGLAAVKKGGLWGYIDESGRERIGFHFLEAGDFQDQKAYVEVAAGEGIAVLAIDRNGKVLG